MLGFINGRVKVFNSVWFRYVVAIGENIFIKDQLDQGI